MKHLARYVPQRACGRCALCRSPPCGTCKNCLYNASISETHKSRKRCAMLGCVRVVERDRKYEIETSPDFRMLLAQLTSLEQTRAKNAAQQVAAYKAGKNQRAAVHRTMREAAELAMAHIIDSGADTLMIDDACRARKYVPYFMRETSSAAAPAAAAPAAVPAAAAAAAPPAAVATIPAGAPPPPPQTMQRVAPK